jgi:Spy/CpxP family protein refolding chaperone
MKTLTKQILVFALPLLIAVGAARAEEGQPAAPDHSRIEQMKERRLKRLDEKLHLTADQKMKITAIWDKAEQDTRAAREDAAASAKEERRAKRREAMKAAHQEVRGVLTPEQQTIFDSMPQDRPPSAPRGDGAK